MKHDNIQSFDQFVLIAAGYIVLAILALAFTFKVARPTMAHKKFLAGLLIVFIPVASLLFYGAIDPPEDLQQPIPAPLGIIMGTSFIAAGMHIIYRATDGLSLWQKIHNISKIGKAATPVIPTKANFYVGGACLIFMGVFILAAVEFGL